MAKLRHFSFVLLVTDIPVYNFKSGVTVSWKIRFFITLFCHPLRYSLYTILYTIQVQRNNDCALLFLFNINGFKSEQDTDFQKTIYASRLASMSLQSGTSSSGVDRQCPNKRGSLLKLELDDGSSLFAKLVVILA